MTKIDSIGVYLVDVVDGVVNTSTKGFPQLAITYNVAQKYVQTPEEMAHFGIEEPAYVDYSSFQYQDSAFFTLFGKDGEPFDEDVYYESFFNVDLPNGSVYWNEKDPDYREPLLRALGVY